MSASGDCDHYYSIVVTRAGARYDIASDADSCTLEDEAGGPSQLDVTVSDPYRVFSHALREGMDVELELGSTLDHELVFRGFITRVESDFPEEGTPTIRIVAHDRRARMGLRERHRPFRNQRVADLIQEVVGPYFPLADVSVDGNLDFDINGMRQEGISDLDLLLRLADKLECQLLLELQGNQERLRFVPLKQLYQQAPALTAYYGRADVEHLLLSFRPLVDVADLRLPVKRLAMDPQQAEIVEVDQEAVEPPRVFDELGDDHFARFQRDYPERATRLIPLRKAAEQMEWNGELGTVRFGEAPPFLGRQQAAEHGKNRVARRLLGMRAEGKMAGTPELRAARRVEVKDVGARFSGEWYVTKARHVVDGDGYHTEFECER